MAIIQQPDVLSLSGNLKKFEIYSGTPVAFILKEGSTTIFEASYDPGANGKVFIDVKDIVENRLSFELSHELFYEQLSLVKTFTATVDGADYSFKVIRSGVANLADTVSNWLTGNFLTWQPTKKYVTYYSPEWLTYFSTVASIIKLKAYLPDNTEQTVTIGSCEAGKAFTCNLQYAEIAGELNQKYPIYYDVWVEDADGFRLTYIQRYIYSDPKSELEQWFLFENSLGGIDTLRAAGDTDFEALHTHNISEIGHVASEYLIDTERYFMKNTGHLDTYERRWLLDFFPSHAKYLHYNGAIRGIVVTEDDPKYSASDLPSSYTFRYRFADDTNCLLNLIRNEDNIPAMITIPDLESPGFSLPPRLSEFPLAQLHEGVIVPVFDPHTENPMITTFGQILATAISETLIKIQEGEGGGELVNVLRTTSPEGASDYSVFSSLRTLDEIEKYFQEHGSEEYLSKIKDDTAQGIITFLQGIVAAETSTFAKMLVTGKITAYDIDVTNIMQVAILKVLVQAEIETLLLKGQMNSETFASGMLGTGMRLAKINDDWTLELDKIIVRKSMEVYEIIVQRIRYQGGQVIHSPAGAKLTAVTDGGSYWRCEHDGTVDIITDAQVLCQNFNVGTRTENPDGSLTLNGVSVKRWWRRVTSFGPGWFNLSKTDCEAGSGTPEVSDEVVVLGHRTNTDWQNAILIASTGGNTPFIAHYAGINSFSLVGKEVVREGNLQGTVDEDFGQLTGFGLYSKNVYLKGVFRLMSGKTVDEAIGEVDNNLEAYKSYVQTEFELIPGKISMEVSKIRVGGRNLLRNYDQRFGMKYWSDGAESVNESGTPVTPTLTIVGFTYIEPISVGVGGTPLYPSSISLAISDGTTKVVPATWSEVDTSTTGPKTSIAAYVLPAGVTGNKPVVSVIVNVTVGQLLIASIIEPQPVTIFAGDTASLPATVTLNLNDGSTRIVDVTWAAYDNVTAGDKIVQAAYNMPSGVMGTKPPITITVTVIAITILSVVQPGDVIVQQNNTPVLPSTITLNLSNSTTVQVPVMWGSYSTEELGEFEISGTYDHPQYVTGEKPVVTLTLTVQYDAVPVTVSSVVQPDAITAPVGGEVDLPATITLNLSDGTTEQVAVTWGAHSTETAGVYNIPGTYSLPAGVTGSKPSVSLTLTVDASIVALWNGKSYIGSMPGTAIPSMSDWSQLSSGNVSACVKNDGTLWMWGANTNGELGLGGTANINTPTQLGGDTDWGMVACAINSTIAIKNGKLYAWGLNNYGQLGLGDTTDRTTPTQVGSFTDWTYVAMFGQHAAAIRGGMLYKWGRNNLGQLGLYDTNNRLEPVRIGSATDWGHVACGTYHTLGIRSGKLYAWGYNGDGQLGLGNNTQYNYPVQVGSATDWSKVSAGDSFSIGLRATDLYGWGNNGAGQAGLGTLSSSTTPVLVGSGFTDIAAGEFNALGVKSNGVYGWGWKNTIGHGDAHIKTPTLIREGTSFEICAGRDAAFIIDAGVLWATGTNTDGRLGVGDNISRTDWVMVGNLVLTLTESNSGVSSFTNALKTGWVDQKGYLYLNNKSASPVSISVNKSGVVTTTLLLAGIAQYAVDLDGATAFGIDGTDYEVEVIEFEIGQYGVEPVWFETT